MILLQSDITQSVLPITAVVAIVLFIAGLISIWFKMISNKEKMGIRIDQLEKDFNSQNTITKTTIEKVEALHKEENLGLKNTLRNTKKELDLAIEKATQITHTRIDRVRDDNIKSYEKLERRIEELDKKGEEHTKVILDAIKGKK